MARLSITSGFMRGRALSVAEHTRPSGVRCRKTLFDLLSYTPVLHSWRMALEHSEGVIIDCFAGSGVVGAEFLLKWTNQRGVFIEKEKKALMAIKANMALLGLENRCLMRAHSCGDEIIGIPSGENITFCFADPPYDFLLSRDFFLPLMRDVAKENFLLVVQTDPQAPPPNFNGFAPLFCRKQGRALLSFFLKG
jgi:16S rRNA G966 N2-methylase RsmD